MIAGLASTVIPGLLLHLLAILQLCTRGGAESSWTALVESDGEVQGTARSKFQPWLRKDFQANALLADDSEKPIASQDGERRADTLQGSLLHLDDGSFLGAYALAETLQDRLKSGFDSVIDRIRVLSGLKPTQTPEDEIEEVPEVPFEEGKASDATRKAIEAAKKQQQDLSTTLALNKTEQDNVAASSALMIIGQLTIFMLALYVLNSTDVSVRRLAWVTVHMLFSIFIGMLLFMSTKSFWILVVGHKYDNSDVTLAVSMGRFFAAWALGPVLLLKRGRDEETMEAYSAIIQWFTAFAGADAFGELLVLDPFSSNKAACFGGVALCVGSVWLACFTASWARYFVIMAASVEIVDGVSAREQKERWGEAYQDGETVYAGFIVGLVVSMWVRFMVSGTLPGPYASPKGHSAAEIGWLAMWTGIVLVISLAVVIVAHLVSGPERSWGLRRAATVAKSVSSMCAAWMVLSTIEWTFWHLMSTNSIGQASDMTAGMSLALFNSVVMFLWIIIIDKIADFVTGDLGRAIRATALSFQLIIGISWQRVFYVAIKYAGRRFKQQERTVDIILIWAVCAVVLPAWFQFILPSVLDAKMEDPDYVEEATSARPQVAQDADSLFKQNAGGTPRGLPYRQSLLLTPPPAGPGAADLAARQSTPAAVKPKLGAASPRGSVVAKADSAAVAKARASLLVSARTSVTKGLPGAPLPKAALAAPTSETDEEF